MDPTDLPPELRAVLLGASQDSVRRNPDGSYTHTVTPRAAPTNWEAMLTQEDEEPFCYTCRSSGHFDECENCDGMGSVDGYDPECDYDFEDTCSLCGGDGGWWECLGTAHHDLSEGSVHRIPLEERQPGN